MSVVQKREDDCRKICLKILEDVKVKKFLNYKGINLNDAYYKTLLALFSSNKILLIYKHIVEKKDKIKLITYSSLEELLILKNLIKLYKIKNVRFKQKIQIKTFIYNFLYKITYSLLETILYKDSVQHFKTEILSYNRKSLDKNNHFSYLKKVNFTKKNIYLNLSYVLKNFFLFNKNFYRLKITKKSDLGSINKMLIKNIFIKHLIEINNPQIITYFEGDNDVSAMINAICKQKKIKTICFQWGSIGKYPKNAFYKLKADYFFAWGKIYEKKILKINPWLKTVICGSPLLKLNNKKVKKNILFSLQKKNPLLDPNTSDSSIEDLKKLIFWASKNIKNYNIIIRPHPSKNNILDINDFKKNIKFIIHEPNKFSLNESLNSSEFFVTIDSSSAIEACSAKLLPLWLNNKKRDYEDNIEKIRSVNSLKLIGNLNQIKKTLAILSKTKHLKEKVLKKISLTFNQNIKYKDEISRLVIQKNIIKIQKITYT
jgi:hypothetical protein